MPVAWRGPSGGKRMTLHAGAETASQSASLTVLGDYVIRISTEHVLRYPIVIRRQQLR